MPGHGRAIALDALEALLNDPEWIGDSFLGGDSLMTTWGTTGAAGSS